MKRKNPAVYLYLSAVASYEHGHVYAHPVVLEGGRPMHFRWLCDGHSRSADYEDLRVSCQLDDRPDSGAYAWEVAYAEAFLVDVHRAGRMANTLRKIHRRMAASGEPYADPDTYAQYVLAVGAAIGARGYIVEWRPDPEILPPGAAREWIDARAAELKRGLMHAA